MNTTPVATQTNTEDQADLGHMQALEEHLDLLVEVSKLQGIALKIESEGTPEMKAKLKPFKEHYDANVMTLITKRTKQNFDNDVWQEVSKAGDAAKAKYRQNPEGYLTQEQHDEYWNKAYSKTIDEALKLKQNLEQVVNAGKPAAPNVTAPRRRLFSH